MTTLLLLISGARADWYWANICGPGTPEDRAASRAGSSGEPYPGYHIATSDPSKPWNEMITLADGTQRRNQYIAKDSEQGTAAVNRDPADGVYGTGTRPFRGDNQNYDYNKDKQLFTVPEGAKTHKDYQHGNTNVGYPLPVTAVPDSYVSVIQEASQDGVAPHAGAEGLKLSTGPGYNKLAEDNEYMLLVFGAKWCPGSEEFRGRFQKYYNNKIKADSTIKAEAVYFSNDNNQHEFQADSYGCPSAPFDQELADKLERALGHNEVPCVIVVDKQGNTVTTDGVRAIKGESHTGSFPLPTGAEFFTDAPILPNGAECKVDQQSQRAELKAHADREVDAMNYDDLVKESAKVAHGDTVPSGEAALRSFVQRKMREAVDNADEARVQELYAAEQQSASRPEEYKFKVGDMVRVVKAFSSDPERPGSAASPIALMVGNKRNTGRVNRVGSAASGAQGAAGVEGAIQVRFDDNAFAQRWILPEHFENIEKIQA